MRLLIAWVIGDLVGFASAWFIAHSLGYRKGRGDAARDILDHPGPNPSPAKPVWWAGYAEAQKDAADIARGGAQ